jgi:tetratricopeptide (TPR) repeat protein
VSLHRCCLVLLLVSASFASAQQWTEVQSPHFTVITDAGEKRGREVALRFEQVHDSFGVILQKMKVNSPVPLTIIALKNNKEIANYAPLFHGKPTTVAGFFQQGQDRDFIVVDLSSETGWHVVYHEYAHLLLHSNFDVLPVWFDEGFAEYFATLRVEKKDLFFGEMSDSVKYILLQNSWMKSASLFAINHESPEYNENGDHTSVFYSQSWLAVHYLMDKRKMTEASKFIDDVQNRKETIASAFQRAFGMTTEQFDKELQNYFHSANAIRYYQQAAPAGLAEGAYNAKLISLLDAQAALADLHFHEMDYRARAIEEFQAILQKEPNNAIANRGLGYAWVFQRKYDDALPLIKKAVEADPTDAQGHYLYAYLLSRESGLGEEHDAERAATIANEAQAAIAINPEFADAYELLGRAALLKHDNAAAQDALFKAIELNPQDEHYRMNLASFYMSTRNWDSAKQVLEPVASDPDSKMAATARMQIAEIERIEDQEKSPPPEFAHNHSETEDASPQEQPEAESAVLTSLAPVHYAKGKLLRVDCSADPGAKFVVEVGGQQWTFSAADRKHLVLLGENTVSCDWHNRKVAINYRDRGEKAGDIVSLELQ